MQKMSSSENLKKKKKKKERGPWLPSARGAGTWCVLRRQVQTRLPAALLPVWDTRSTPTSEGEGRAYLELWLRHAARRLCQAAAGPGDSRQGLWGRSVREPVGWAGWVSRLPAGGPLCVSAGLPDTPAAPDTSRSPRCFRERARPSRLTDIHAGPLSRMTPACGSSGFKGGEALRF